MMKIYSVTTESRSWVERANDLPNTAISRPVLHMIATIQHEQLATNELTQDQTDALVLLNEYAAQCRWALRNL